MSVDLLRKRLIFSGLLEEAEVRSFLDDLPEGEQPAEAGSLAKLLVRSGKLTEYQAKVERPKRRVSISTRNWRGYWLPLHARNA